MTEKYVLQISSDPTFYYDTAFVFNDTVEATTYALSNLIPYTQYAWRVQAICGEEFGERVLIGCIVHNGPYSVLSARLPRDIAGQ